MARLIDRLTRPSGHERAIMGVPWGWPQETIIFNGHSYVAANSSWGPAETNFGYGAAQALASNGVAYGIFRTRLELFAQGEFRFRRLGNPRPTLADSFTTDALAPLEPTIDLLGECDLQAARAGAAFFVFDGDDLRSLIPEFCTIVCESRRYADDPMLAWDAKPAGLMYQPNNGTDPETWRWDEVIAYIPERDPEARWRGMSWLRPAMEDINADNSARRYLTKFFANHATPNAAVVFPPEVTKETVEAFRDVFLARYRGVERSGQTAFLGGGADIKVIGASLKDLDSEKVRQQVHKDIATAAGVPIVAAGVEQGTYANSKESNRALADRKVRYLWAAAASTFAKAVDVPAGARLYVETSHIAALQADALDDANVIEAQARTMSVLANSGWHPDSARDGVTKGDLSGVAHTGNLSVQLLPPGTEKNPASAGATDG